MAGESMVGWPKSATSQTGDSGVTEELDCKYAELLLWSWGHDIRGRTATIRDLVYLIRHRLAEPSPDWDSVNSLLNKIERISGEIGTKTPSPLELAQVSLNMLIKERVHRWETIESRYPVEFQVDPDPNQPIIDTNPIWLGRVLDVLIENAVGSIR
jgi:signal transduction histidine kinase